MWSDKRGPCTGGCGATRSICDTASPPLLFWAWDGFNVNYRLQLTAIPIGEGVTNDLLLTILQLTSLGEINLFVRLVYLIIGFCFK